MRPACKTPSPRSWSRAIIAMNLRRQKPVWCAATTLITLSFSTVRTPYASAAPRACCGQTQIACMPWPVLVHQSTDAPASLRSFKRPRSTPQQAKRQSRNGSAIANALRTRCFVLLAYIRALRWRAPRKISCSSFQLQPDCLEIRTLNVVVAGCISAPSARMSRANACPSTHLCLARGASSWTTECRGCKPPCFNWRRKRGLLTELPQRPSDKARGTGSDRRPSKTTAGWDSI
mmetsp:Transcript_67014/g.108667  ORF Transcript_67014/g.108667 Transcript_67014/m.108667 type:complete len:233 (-) Transcript_67014:2151-2849(-)